MEKKVEARMFLGEYSDYLLDIYGRVFSTKSNKYLAYSCSHTYQLYNQGRPISVNTRHCGKMIDWDRKCWIVNDKIVILEQLPRIENKKENN